MAFGAVLNQAEMVMPASVPVQGTLGKSISLWEAVLQLGIPETAGLSLPDNVALKPG